MKALIRTCACVVALSVTTAGCFKHKYEVGNGGDTTSHANYNEWENHWFFGIVGESELKVDEICPSGDATVQDRQSFLNGLVTAILLGGLVWAPSTVRVYCGEGGGEADESNLEDAVEDVDDAAEEPGEAVEEELGLKLTPTQMRAIAQHPATMRWVERHMPEQLGDYQAALGRQLHGQVMASGVAHRL